MLGPFLRSVLCLLLLALISTAVSAAPPTPSDTVALAAAEAGKLRDPEQQSIAQADLAVAWHKLGDNRWETAATSAETLAEQVEEPIIKAMTWRGLAVRLWTIKPDAAKALLERSLTASRALPYAAPKALALRELGRSLVPLNRDLARQCFDEAAETARTIQSVVFRVAALRDIAAAAQALDPNFVSSGFKEASAALAIIPQDDPTQLARSELAVAWSLTDFVSASREADTIPEERLREACFRQMCEVLAPVNPDVAMMAIARLHDQGQRVQALAALAAHLPSGQAETATVMARSVLAAKVVLSPEDKAHLQADAAVGLAATDLKEALKLVSEVADEELSGRALGRIALRLTQTRPADALQILLSIQDWGLREEYQTQLAPSLARTDAAKAVDMASKLLSRTEKIKALLAIADCLTPPAAHSVGASVSSGQK